MYDDVMTDETPAQYYKRNGPCQHECLKSCAVSKECLKQSARLYGPVIERDIRIRRRRRLYWMNVIMLILLCVWCLVTGYMIGTWVSK